VQPGDPGELARTEPPGLGKDPVQVRAELRRHAGHGQALARHRRGVVDPQQDAHGGAQRAGHPVELVQPVRRVDGEPGDTGLDRLGDVAITLARSGVEDLRGRETGL